MKRNNSGIMSTFPALNIISVVTSPVIIATPPAFAEKTINVANARIYSFFMLRAKMIVNDTNVAVKLSASDEKKNVKVPIIKRSFFKDIFLGRYLYTIFSINPCLSIYATNVIAAIRKSHKIAISNILSSNACSTSCSVSGLVDPAINNIIHTSVPRNKVDFALFILHASSKAININANMKIAVSTISIICNYSP